MLIHTLKQGTYVRTLTPHNPPMIVTFVGIAGGTGNIIVAGNVPSTTTKGMVHSVLYLFTVNGKLIKRVKLEDTTNAMYVENDRVVLGGANGSLEIRCTSGLSTKHKLRLKSGVVSVSIDPRKQHLFVTTNDGKMVIITSTAKPFVKK